MPEEGYDLPEDHPVLKALREEREARKQAERRARFTEISATYPQVGLTPEDFEGLTPDKWEARAQRLAALKGTSVSEGETTQAVQEEEVPNRDALARMQQPFETKPVGAEEAVKMGADELFKLYKKNPAEFERLRAAGRLVNFPQGQDRGGSVIFGGE